ncbi:GFA family protein [Nordella sp. HKS 07]|uniref:GFA family protein n=1 Tax=Nordella sp. HKS 07 TaxID=2712222 RepID=UPI0013E19EE2|nr:GFA family protein [Nordella sp. HKS 07]QIG51199.1 GFA family protein [Nordella sp. HKS 07]
MTATSPDYLEGGCACGKIRYRLAMPPMFVNCCHCRDCQRQTGSAFVINALTEMDRIEVLRGTPEAVSVPTDSGRPHDIYRCPDCRIALWGDYGRRPGLRFLRVGTLDDPAALTPDAHIFTRSKLPWVRLPDHARAFEIYYDMEKEWPPDSLKRREAILGPGK